MSRYDYPDPGEDPSYCNPLAAEDEDMSKCFVRADDYRFYWQTQDTSDIQIAWAVTAGFAWAGVERRMAGSDRRSPNHERRWEASRGRRFNLKDRRRP